MRLTLVMASLFTTGWVLSGCSSMPEGLAFSGSTPADRVQLLVDETWTHSDLSSEALAKEGGRRHVQQEIFDSVFEMIDEAEQFILLDFFLVNDFLYEPGPNMRHLSRELTDRLAAKRLANPDVEIIFITDPVNTVYNSIPSPLFQTLEKAGVRVVWTDLDRLRDSNPIISKPWRLFVRSWGTGPGDAVANPIGKGRISRRSMLKLLNLKANHRKLIVTDKSLLVASANPHSASGAHWNMALRVDGAGQALACEAESAILRMSGAEPFNPQAGADRRAVRSPKSNKESGAFGESALPPQAGNRLQLLTERKIKETVLELLNSARSGTRINLTMFYLADADIIRALIAAKKRGCSLRIILDPNKDAFGRLKNGIPNRQSAARLVKAGIPVRWADTHGEQCHVKTLYVEHPAKTATLLLGSANYTRRNLDNFNAECNLAYTAPLSHATMTRAREVFDRWWKNPDNRIYTTGYETYEDRSIRRKLKARLMEASGLSSF